MQEKTFTTSIAAALGLPAAQVSQTMQLLDSDHTVPFIARYRKEVTGGLDEVQIRDIEDRLRYARNLAERKTTVLESIEKQGKLTRELQEKIARATILREVEDLYLPYKPKRRTRATMAREMGLGPLAEMLLAQELESGSLLDCAEPFIRPEKNVTSAESALAGARDIIAETIAEDADIRKSIRAFTLRTGMMTSKAKDSDKPGVNEMYADYREPVTRILPHRILAVNRGEREGKLRVALVIEKEPALQIIKQRYVTRPNSIFIEQLELAIADGYERLLAPTIERELRHELTEKADKHAIAVFSENVKNLLLAPPVRDKIIMGIDPGLRTGCKVAVIEKTGKYLQGITIYPHPPKNRWDYSKVQLTRLIAECQVDIVAIGNGTGSRETEKLVAEVVSEMDKELYYVIVNEAGASVYSASPVAKEEFPDLPAEMRGNISIARRLLDPLSELVKIDSKSIGVGLYQHDVNQNRLSESLDRVVESAVNYVGVDLNTASKSLLRYVSGITNRGAQNIVEYRDTHGRFRSRAELADVKGIGAAAFTQAAGFLRIPDADLFLDSTAVHPESYPATEKLITRFDLSMKEMKSKADVFAARIRQEKESLGALARDCGVGVMTLQDIIACLEKPSRDPRDEMPKPILRTDVLKMADLREGMVLKGTVRNVVDFGAFVDIGLKTDGLVHKSQMSNRYVKNPMEIASVGDVIPVRILSIDADRNRISLSMVIE